MVARSLLESVGTNAVDECGDGAVVKRVGWRLFFELEIDAGDEVALVCANTQPVVAECKALLVILGNDLVQEFKRQGMTTLGGIHDQVVHDEPTFVIQFHSNHVRLVAKHQAQKLAGRDEPGVAFHRADLMRNELTTRGGDTLLKKLGRESQIFVSFVFFVVDDSLRRSSGYRLTVYEPRKARMTRKRL
jgi:hypothetical protein